MPKSFRTSGTNLTRAKTHNHRVVLEIIRTRGPIGRSEIAEITSLSRQTVQNIVAELDAEGIVEMHAGKASGRGHPGMRVQVRADHACSLGFHVDRLAVTALACNLLGDVIWSGAGHLAAPSTASANALVRDLVAQFRAARPDMADRLFGIGLAAPGPFAADAEELQHLTSTADATTFTEFGLPDNLTDLSGQLKLPVVLQNDASAAALGEHVYGIGRSFGSFAFLQFGMGLGAGFVLNGAIYPGSTKNAGEIGHVQVQHGGRSCSCGSRGCLERYLSLHALCERLGLDPTARASIASIEQRFEAGDPEILTWMDEVAPYMRQAINLIEMMLDPDAIILGGIIRPDFIEALLRRAEPFLPRLAPSAPGEQRIHVGTAGARAVALGASAAAVEALFAPSVAELVLSPA
ncbi:ROK family protein [Microvirga tunisiensis]|uniref:ROK family protein n=1 Tax=Pannonibacter tanglangensis TaxID=2750084 RepID=A0A7X5F0E2_9HYPH|nr:ROK family transcriptional regulator [Pannonibacter sp. XCT-53]NBN77467.1 ROK family protein [Pannonibacter sp. XCT-53]